MDAMGGRLNTPGRRSFSPGEVVLVVFICLIGSGLFSAHRHGVRFGVRGLEMFGDQYDYTISQQRAAAGIERVVFDNPRGNVRITGGDAAEIRITGRKQVRALSKTEADRTDQSTPVQIDAGGLRADRAGQPGPRDGRAAGERGPGSGGAAQCQRGDARALRRFRRHATWPAGWRFRATAPTCG